MEMEKKDGRPGSGTVVEMRTKMLQVVCGVATHLTIE